jgi:hypothetical protein
MKKWILRNFQSPGDVLMLTAAVRDLHLCLPGKFLTDVRTSCPALWENNPHLTPLREEAPGIETIQCEYPLIHESNHASYHFIHGFIEFLNRRLGGKLSPQFFKGDIHLSAREKTTPSIVTERLGSDLPFWIIAAGGKYDFTIKWWHVRRYQAVVDHFQGKILFVQVGEAGHYHPELSGVLDLRGQTDMRQLLCLMHHAQGVLCPVTFLMHLAAAVETRPPLGPNRPCVVVAGGREPPQWEAYPAHQFLHTVGALPCCATGGCWRSRTLPLQDGEPHDTESALCLDVIGGLPRCMAMIQPADVIARIKLYFAPGGCRYLTPQQAKTAGAFLRPSLRQLLPY